MLHTTIRVPYYTWKEFGTIVESLEGTKHKMNAVINHLIKTYVEVKRPEVKRAREIKREQIQQQIEVLQRQLQSEY